MNVENLRTNYRKLILHMEATGYSQSYVGELMTEIQKILMEAEAKDWACYNDVCRDYELIPLSPISLARKRALIGAIMEFDLHGKYPDRKWSRLLERGAYPRLGAEFKSLIDYYEIKERKRGKKESTICTAAQNAASFLLSFQGAGISKLEDITEEAVMSLFVSPHGEPPKSYAHRISVSAFLKVCTPQRDTPSNNQRYTRTYST